MSDEKRIKDFEPATEILNDDWFAVDSPSQGTRKMQASMFQAGLQSQITANRDDIDLQSGQISVLQQAVGNIGDKVDVLDAAITVEEYSATKLYAVDEDCVYEGVRYKCITAIETPEAFTPSHWQAISIEGELNELNSSLTNTTTNLYNFKLLFDGGIKLLGTLGGDVLDRVKQANIGITFYQNSNKPTKAPSNIDWGAYLFIKASPTNCSIFCWDNTHFAATFNVNSQTATNINWQTVH